MRRHFEEQLEELNTELIAMGALCEKAIALAARMLLEDEIGLKREVESTEEAIDRKERRLKISACGCCFSSSLWLAICAPFPPRSR